MVFSGSSTVRLKCGERNGRQPSIALPPVGFEGVGEIVQRNVEQHAQKQIRHAVQQQLVRRVVDHAAAAHEARAEDRVPAFVQHFPVAHHVAAVVRFVGHHDDHGVARAPGRVHRSPRGRSRARRCSGRAATWGRAPWSAAERAQVASVLPSSTTTISCSMPCSRNSTYRCSTVAPTRPSSSRAGITTESSRIGS